MNEASTLLLALTGGNYDIVSWDTRGVGTLTMSVPTSLSQSGRMQLTSVQSLQPRRHCLLRQCHRLQHLLERHDRAQRHRVHWQLHGSGRHESATRSGDGHWAQVHGARKALPAAPHGQVHEVHRNGCYCVRHDRARGRTQWAWEPHELRRHLVRHTVGCVVREQWVTRLPCAFLVTNVSLYYSVPQGVCKCVQSHVVLARLTVSAHSAGRPSTSRRCPQPTARRDPRVAQGLPVLRTARCHTDLFLAVDLASTAFGY